MDDSGDFIKILVAGLIAFVGPLLDARYKAYKRRRKQRRASLAASKRQPHQPASVMPDTTPAQPTYTFVPDEEGQCALDDDAEHLETEHILAQAEADKQVASTAKPSPVTVVRSQRRAQLRKALKWHFVLEPKF